MISNIARIKRRAPLFIRQRGAQITLRWTESSGGTLEPLTGALIGATVTEQSEIVPALIHIVPVASTSQVRQYNEVETGDCIADLQSDVSLDTKENLRFEIDGQLYVQKTVGEELARSWDALPQGQRLVRTVLLRKAT
jgi:hypothetical protein